MVHLDLRHLGEKLINAKLPFVRELCLKYQNIDPVTELIPVRPVVHYMMGGVSTDINGATPLAGLFAAGEVACVSINGANRLGSNSLPEFLVFGARAGRAAAEFASEQRASGQRGSGTGQRRRRKVGVAVPAQDRWPRAHRRHSRRDADNDGAERGHLPRRAVCCRQALDKLRELQERYQDINLDDRSRTFNTELEVGAGTGLHAGRGGVDRAVCAASHGIARRTSAHRLSGARRREIPGALAGLSQRGRLFAGGISAGEDHALAAGGAGLRPAEQQSKAVNSTAKTDELNG